LLAGSSDDERSILLHDHAGSRTTLKKESTWPLLTT